jgi:carbon storage regulator
MLVLTRKVGEELIIDGEIRVSIVHVRGNRVRLGIQAPLDVTIRRQDSTATAEVSKSKPQPRLCSSTGCLD